MQTYMANPDKIERKWYVVDAADYTLGRLASQVAAVLRGKNKPTYSPFLDCGDNVIVIAVKGMLPKGPLGRQMFTKLHVYAGPDHEQAAQKPEVLKF